MNIRPALDDDAAAIAQIYNYYIANTVVTFEEQPVDGLEIAKRIGESSIDALPYLVAEQDGKVLGYAYASKWKGRCAYRYTVEVTVYCHHESGQQGIGSQLYAALFEALAEKKYHMAIAGISLPNEGSIALHEKFGMKKVAHFEEVGYKFDRWVDVAYWQGAL